SPLARFIVTVLAWLPVTFAVWYVVAPVLMFAVKILCMLAVLPLGDLVGMVEQKGSTLAFVTTLRAGQAAQAGGVVSVSVDGLLYSFGMPMFAALTLAAREPKRWAILALGIVALLPFVAFGVVADFLKNVAITSGPLVASQAGFSAAQREMIAFAYQFGTLILPTVAPAIAWVVTHRAFLERMRGLTVPR
ncbi:MAG: exosortase H-associated membrane protein, partial [Vicinamibacteria bacterium]